MTVPSGYYENPADGLVSDIRSQTDRSFLHIRYFVLREGSLKLLLTSLNVDDIYSGARILTRSTTVSKSNTFTHLSLQLVKLGY
jgi:hypothetical protein